MTEETGTKAKLIDPDWKGILTAAVVGAVVVAVGLVVGTREDEGRAAAAKARQDDECRLASIQKARYPHPLTIEEIAIYERCGILAKPDEAEQQAVVKRALDGMESFGAALGEFQRRYLEDFRDKDKGK